MRTIALTALLAAPWGPAALPGPAVAPPGDKPAAEKPAPETDPALRKVLEEATAQLEALRGEALRRPVPARRQSREAFAAVARRELDEELPVEEARREARALARLGLLRAGFDLRASLEKALVSQVGAYYDPEVEALFVVHAPPAMLRFVAVHELTHALQDQRFDLEKMTREAREGGSDREVALAFLVEGEATYVMTLALLPGVERGAGRKLLEGPLLMQARWRRKEIEAMVQAGEWAEGPASPIVGATEDVRDLPDLLFRGLFDPYLKGPLFIHRVIEQGGWEAVDALFRRPPRSSEQVLHPEKLRADSIDEPTAIEIPDLRPALPAGWERLHEDTLGEFGVSVLFGRLAEPPEAPGGDWLDRIGRALRRSKDGEATEALARRAPEGWDGDRYAAYGCGERTLVAWSTFWDTEPDAIEFARALTALWQRAAEGVVLADDARAAALLADGTRGLLERQGSAVHVLVGAPADRAGEIMAILRTSARRRDGGTAREADF